MPFWEPQGRTSTEIIFKASRDLQKKELLCLSVLTFLLLILSTIYSIPFLERVLSATQPNTVSREPGFMSIWNSIYRGKIENHLCGKARCHLSLIRSASGFDSRSRYQKL